MNIAKSRATKAVALALASVLQVYAVGGFAHAAGSDVTASAEPAVRRQGAVQGRLTTTGDNPASVNGDSGALCVRCSANSTLPSSS